jgi:hypothetical protein
VEWLLRVGSEPITLPNGASVEQPTPTLTPDAYRCWQQWLSRVGRGGQPELGQAFEIARRSVRPPSPAAHHRYWRQSLPPRADALVARAARTAGIATSTAYKRLRHGGKRPADFHTSANPEQTLAHYLTEQAPDWQLDEHRRRITQTLIEIGMRPETARKFERRLRPLPEHEQQRRIEAAINRYQPRSTPQPSSSLSI